MSSLLSAVTGTTGETASSQGTERPEETTSGGGGGSRRRNLALAAAGLGTAFFLRRRAGKRRNEDRDTSSTTTGELNAAGSTSDSSDGKQGRSIGGRAVKTVAGIAASVLVRRAIRRWRKR